MRRPIACFDLRECRRNIRGYSGVVDKSLEIAQCSMERNSTSSGSNELLCEALNVMSERVSVIFFMMKKYCISKISPN